MADKMKIYVCQSCLPRHEDLESRYPGVFELVQAGPATKFCECQSRDMYWASEQRKRKAEEQRIGTEKERLKREEAKKQRAKEARKKRRRPPKGPALYNSRMWVYAIGALTDEQLDVVSLRAAGLSYSLMASRLRTTHKLGKWDTSSVHLAVNRCLADMRHYLALKQIPCDF